MKQHFACVMRTCVQSNSIFTIQSNHIFKSQPLSSTVIHRITIFDEQIRQDKNPENQIAKQTYFPEGVISYANKKHHHYSFFLMKLTENKLCLI